MSTAAESLNWQELAHRNNGGMDVSLLWRQIRSRNVVKLLVDDALNEASGEALVPPEHALDAFYHPCVYLGETAVAQAVEPKQLEAGAG